MRNVFHENLNKNERFQMNVDDMGFQLLSKKKNEKKKIQKNEIRRNLEHKNL